MTIRPFEVEDTSAVLHLFDANTPAFFAPEERDDFIFYLKNEIEHYFVLKVEDSIVACGGYNQGPYTYERRISWDLVHPDHQGKGYGGELLKYRIKHILMDDTVKTISVRTSQFVHKFYEKHHFILQEIVNDYWAEGYDLYQMSYDMSQ
jgi:[ribosomal protein S18]-alanine N-acetyltransferase